MLIYGFNAAFNNISASSLKVGNDSMIVIRFWTTEKGNLPHLSYILRNPETLGKEFKKVACSITGALLFIDSIYGRKG